MLEGISTTCFAASYLLALVLEVARLFFASRARMVLTLVLVAAGIVAHTLYLGDRAVQADASPLSSPHDWYLLAAWTLAVLYLALALARSRAALGVFLLPLILVLVALAQVADRAPFAPVRASRFWGNVHGVCLLLGTVTVLVGVVAAVMYLVQSYRLKHKRLPSPRFRLPTLEWLEKANIRAMLLSVLLIGGGFLSGVVLNVIKYRKEQQTVPWSDPVVWTLALMFLWLLAASLFSLVYPPARRGRKVAYLTLATFVFLAIVLAAVLPQATHNPQRAIRNLESSLQSTFRNPQSAFPRQPGGAA